MATSREEELITLDLIRLKLSADLDTLFVDDIENSRQDWDSNAWHDGYTSSLSMNLTQIENIINELRS